MGRRYDDATVMALAAAFERAAPWKGLVDGGTGFEYPRVIER